jgi:hypothetical protein
MKAFLGGPTAGDPLLLDRDSDRLMAKLSCSVDHVFDILAELQGGVTAVNCFNARPDSVPATVVH